MWAFTGVLRGRLAICIWLILLAASAAPAVAQDAPPIDPSATPREQELRDQLRNILHV